MTTKLISSSDIEAIVIRYGLDHLLDKLIECLGIGFAQLDPPNSLIPPRSGIQYMDPDMGLIEWMPASIAKGTATLKLVAYHPSNPQKRNLPTVISSICIFDTKSGHLRGILDGTFLTALRTGAMSALATKLLGKASSRTLGIIGCGAQSVTQVHALSRVIPFDSVLAYDKDPGALASFADRVAFMNMRIKTYQLHDLQELLERSNVLCTCTSERPGSGPLFDDFDAKPWLHINAVGSDFPDKCELPISLLRRSYVCPDFAEQARAEGECQQLQESEIGLDLGNLINKPDLADAQREKLSVFDSTGHAFSDYITGLLFIDYAEKLGLGSDIDIECLPSDPKDPYSFLSTTAKQSLQRANASEVL